jgi:NRPS condensation-like uncharacterized protein
LRCVEDVADQWTDVVEDEINEPIPWPTGPLVRCVLIRHARDLHHVVVTFHHLIGDGMSGVILIRDLVRIAGGGTATAPPPLPRAVPMDWRLPRSVRGWRGFWRVLRFALRTVGEDLRFKPPDRVRPDREAPPQGRRTVIFARELDEAMTAKLVDRSRREGTTIHAALSAALCLGVAHDIAGDRPISLKHRSPVNLRSALDPPVADDIGMFASMTFYRGRLCSRDDFWELARAIRNRIAGETKRGTPAIAVKMVPVMYALLGGRRLSAQELAVRWERYTATTTGLTNLGRLDIGAQAGPLRVESLHFAVSPGAVGDLTSTAATLEGRLYWNFMFPEPILARPRGARLADDIVQRLQRAVLRDTEY